MPVTQLQDLFDQVQVRTPEGKQYKGTIVRISAAGANVELICQDPPELTNGDHLHIGFLFEGDPLGNCTGVVTKIHHDSSYNIVLRFLSAPGQNQVPVGLRMAIEQRHDPRIVLCSKDPVEVDCSRGSERSPLFGVLTDLSLGGAGVEIQDLEEELSSGSQMYLRFLLPGQTKLCTVLAQVRHTREEGDRSVCGVQFMEPSCDFTERSRAAIREFVTEQAIQRMRTLVQEATPPQQ